MTAPLADELGPLTWAPITSRRPVSTTSGISANGIPNESTTWLSTSAPVVLTPSARMISAGSIVTVRRTTMLILTAMNPAITTWPANVPTLEDDAPEASSATAKASAAPPPTRWPICACAPWIVSTPVSPDPCNSLAATASIARLIRPARLSATITLTRS